MDAILSPHPATPPSVRMRLRAAANRVGDELVLRYVLEAPLDALRIPPPKPARPKHMLWRHTCFEAFVALVPGGPYHELNLSPSGEFAVYAFSTYRQNEPLAEDAISPGIVTTATRDGLELTARVALAPLSPGYEKAAVHVALSAVVEDASGGIVHFAAHHAGDQADFHHAAGFTLRLDPPA
jgi:hypothetical protein